MNTLKLLTLVQIYINTYICQALARYSDRSYCKGTGRVLKKKISSRGLRTLFGWPSGLLRTCVGSSSGALRLLVGYSSGRSRSTLEADSKPSRSVAEPVSNESRRSLEALPKTTRRKAKENLRKGRICSGDARYLTGLFLAVKSTIDSQLSYRECTESVLKRYWKGTKELLKRYQIATKQVQAFGSFLVDRRYKLGRAMGIPAKMHSGDLEIGAYGCCLKSEGLQAFCGNRVYGDEYLVVQKKISAQKALKYFSVVAGYGKGYRMSLTCLLLMIVSMFSLSAQTPRKDSGADGLSSLVALKPGDKIPDAVWNRSLELNYFNGKKKTIKFAELKGKLILLDFWSTGCPSCIEGIPDMELIQQRFKDKVQVVMVNSKRNRDTPERIKRRFKKYKEDFNYTPVLPTILDDTLFTSLFPHNTLPTIGIINPSGQFVLNSFASSITEDIIQDFLKTGVSNRFIEKSEIKNTARINTQPLVDTTGLVFCSVMSGYRENYLGVYPAVAYSKGNSLFQVGNYFLNTCYQLAFPDVFKGAQSGLFVFDDRINKEFIDLIYDFKTTKGQFWYQLYLRDSIAQELAFDYFRKALIERFHIAVERKKGAVAAYALSLDVSRPLWKTKGGMYINSVDRGNESLILQNVPIHGVISFIRSVLDKPVIFEGKSAERIDLRLPGNFLDLSIKEKIAALEQHGIKLTPTQYNGEYPYFYSVSTQHTK